MIERPIGQRTPVPPQLARRVEILGVLACVLFAIILLRLWYLQVLTGPQNVATANANVVRTIAIPAPRGLILDRNGKVLAGETVEQQVGGPRGGRRGQRQRGAGDLEQLAGVRQAAVAAIACSELPSSLARRASLYRALGVALAIPATQITKALTPCDSFAPIVLRADIPSAALIYLEEHKAQFPGLIEEQIAVRTYPYDNLGAQILGAPAPTRGVFEARLDPLRSSLAPAEHDAFLVSGIARGSPRYVRRPIPFKLKAAI